MAKVLVANERYEIKRFNETSVVIVRRMSLGRRVKAAFIERKPVSISTDFGFAKYTAQAVVMTVRNGNEATLRLLSAFIPSP
jgi:hypothetical protein